MDSGTLKSRPRKNPPPKNMEVQPMSDFADRFAITELLHRYILAIDAHDNEAFADCFTADGVYESPFGAATGREAIRGTIAQWHTSGVTHGKRHFAGPIQVQPRGDEATAFSYYWVAEALANPGVVASGTYTDVLRKVDGEWRLAQRKQTIDPSFKPQG
jgi:uncharacterized protein (TIGR02246 family)